MLGGGEARLRVHPDVFTDQREEGRTVQPRHPTEEGVREQERPLRRYIAFATNIPKRFVVWNVRRRPDDYRRRWDIESGYADVEGLRARTTSRNYSLRLLCHFYVLVLYNAWLLANLIIAKRFSKLLEKDRS